MLVVLPVPLTPTTSTTAGTSGAGLRGQRRRVPGGEQRDELGLERELRGQVAPGTRLAHDLHRQVGAQVRGDERLLDPSQAASSVPPRGSERIRPTRPDRLRSRPSWSFGAGPRDRSTDGSRERAPVGDAPSTPGRSAQPQRHDTAHRVVACCHAVQRVGRLDGAPVVGDDDELDLSARLRSAAAKRPTFASSSAASTSSSTQKGTGRTSSIASSSATAVSARSPPESIASGWRFLPGAGGRSRPRSRPGRRAR